MSIFFRRHAAALQYFPKK